MGNCALNNWTWKSTHHQTNFSQTVISFSPGFIYESNFLVDHPLNTSNIMYYFSPWGMTNIHHKLNTPEANIESFETDRPSCDLLQQQQQQQRKRPYFQRLQSNDHNNNNKNNYQDEWPSSAALLLKQGQNKPVSITSEQCQLRTASGCNGTSQSNSTNLDWCYSSHDMTSTSANCYPYLLSRRYFDFHHQQQISPQLPEKKQVQHDHHLKHLPKRKLMKKSKKKRQHHTFQHLNQQNDTSILKNRDIHSDDTAKVATEQSYIPTEVSSCLSFSSCTLSSNEYVSSKPRRNPCEHSSSTQETYTRIEKRKKKSLPWSQLPRQYSSWVKERWCQSKPGIETLLKRKTLDFAKKLCVPHCKTHLLKQKKREPIIYPNRRFNAIDIIKKTSAVTTVTSKAITSSSEITFPTTEKTEIPATATCIAKTTVTDSNKAFSEKHQNENYQHNPYKKRYINSPDFSTNISNSSFFQKMSASQDIGGSQPLSESIVHSLHNLNFIHPSHNPHKDKFQAIRCSSRLRPKSRSNSMMIPGTSFKKNTSMEKITPQKVFPKVMKTLTNIPVEINHLPSEHTIPADPAINKTKQIRKLYCSQNNGSQCSHLCKSAAKSHQARIVNKFSFGDRQYSRQKSQLQLQNGNVANMKNKDEVYYTFFVRDTGNSIAPLEDNRVQNTCHGCRCTITYEKKSLEAHLTNAEKSVKYYRGMPVRVVTISASSYENLRRCLAVIDNRYPQLNCKSFLDW